MDENQFNKLIEQLERLSNNIESLKNTNKEAEDLKKQQEMLEETIISSLSKDRNDTKFTGNEKRRVQNIAKIFKLEFQGMFDELKPKDKKGSSKILEITFDKKTYRELEKTLRNVLPDYFESLEKKLEKQKEKKTGIFGFLGDIIGGTFGAFGALNKVVPFLLAAGGLALAFYIVKNIKNIADSLDTIFKSGKENLPTILESLKNNLFPFWDDFTNTAVFFFDRTLDSIDNFIDKLPELFSILLDNIPMLREQITTFFNEMEMLGDKLAQNSFFQNLGFLFSLALPVGLIAAIVAITKPLRLLNAAATASLVYSLGYYFSSFKELEKVNWDTIAKAGVSIGGLLAVLFFSSKSLPNANAVKGMLAAGGVAAGTVLYLRELATVLKEWKDIDWQTLGKAEVALGGLFAGIAASRVLGNPAVLKGIGVFFLGGAAIAGSIWMIGEALGATMSSYYSLQELFKRYSEMNGSNLISVAAGITALFGALTLQSFGGIAQALAGGTEKFVNFITGQKSSVDKIREFEQIDGIKLDRNAKAIKNIFDAIRSGGGNDVSKAIDNLNKIKFDKLGNIISVPKPVQPGTESKPVVAEDFVSRPNQPPILFSPDDSIIGLKRANLFEPLKDLQKDNYEFFDKQNKLFIETVNKTFEKMKNDRIEDRKVLNKLNESITKLSESQANNVAMINNSKTNTNITIAPTTSKSFRDSRYR